MKCSSDFRSASRITAGPRRKLPGCILLALAGLALPWNPGLAQDAVEHLRPEISAFSRRLQDGLGLNERSGLFSPQAGDVNATYLWRQGVVVEITTRLGADARPITLATVSSSLQHLSHQLSGVGEPPLVQRPDVDAMREVMALSLRQDAAGLYYRALLAQISSIDFLQEADLALRDASEAARALHGFGEISSSGFTQISGELMEIRESLGEQMQGLSALHAEVRRSSATVQEDMTAEQLRAHWESRLNALLAQIEPVRQSALARARELNAQRRATEQALDRQRQQDIVAFETRLFQLACSDIAIADVLPEGEFLTLILPGLGESGAADRLSSRIHVLSRVDLLKCQSGAISAMQLQRVADSYHF